MAELADVLYSGKPDAAPTSPTQTPGQAQHAALAADLYGKTPVAPTQSSGDTLFDGPATIDQTVASIVEAGVDRGAILPDQANAVAVQLNGELDALQLGDQSNRAGLMRDLARPALTGSEAELARGATMRALHDKYGPDYAALLTETNRWLAKTAPTIGAALSRSLAGNSLDHVTRLVDAYQRSQRGSR